MTFCRVNLALLLCCSVCPVLHSSACSPDTTGPNRPPVAMAGTDRSVVVNQTVELDASGSYDPDGDDLAEYRWAILVAPAGSSAALAEGDSPEEACLTPDAPGVWAIRLVVGDGRLDSEPDVVRIIAASRCETDADCNDSNPCTDDICDPVNDCIHNNNSDPCDDGDPCTMNDTCQEGSCQGVPLDEDNDGYTSAACGGTDCDDSRGDINPGTFEGPEGDDKCSDGVDNDCDGLTDLDDTGCLPCVEDEDCIDSNFCNGQERCVDNECIEGTPPDCEDEKECTEDSCDPELGCQHDPVADGTECGTRSCDGRLWKMQTCQSGDCSGTATIVDCSAGTDCTTEAECDATEGCVGGNPVQDGTSCQSGDGICCLGICHLGWKCCVDGDCDDGNSCTGDNCDEGTCTHPCLEQDCMNLSVDDEAAVGEDIIITIETCDPALDIDEFVCESGRNHDGIFASQNFETGFGDFSANNNTTREQAAQNPHSPVPGNWGIQMCGNEAGLTIDLDSWGHHGLGFKFSMANASLNGNEQMLAASYYNGSEWHNMLLVGDGLQQPYRDYYFILPDDADDNDSLTVEFWLHGGSAQSDDCAYVDDVSIFDALTRDSVRDIIWEGFDFGFGVFSEHDPDGNDVRRDWYDGDWRVRIVDNENASLYTTNAIDTRSVNPYNLLVVGWHWRERYSLDAGDYIFVEYSLDDGNNWQELAAIGHSYSPSDYTYYQAVLPCEAIGITGLRLRFIGPDSAGNSGGESSEGAYIDHVRLTEWQPRWVDSFGAFTNDGNGIYSGKIISSKPGNTRVICRYGCGASAIWTEVIEVTVAGQ